MRNEKKVTINYVGIMYSANNVADERIGNWRSIRNKRINDNRT